jgi:hypothetical protein
MMVAGFFTGVVLIGGIGWLLRRFWRDTFWPPFLPAMILALIQIMAGQSGYALVSILVGILWWQIFAFREGRARGEDGPPQR